LRSRTCAIPASIVTGPATGGPAMQLRKVAPA
jgi:hypothetical protein